MPPAPSHRVVCPRRDLVVPSASLQRGGARRRAAALLLLLLSTWSAGGKPEGLAAYSRGQYEQALEELKWVAMSGDRDAQTLVGTMYLQGLGTDRDAEQAAFFLQQAADQGDPVAQRTLGEMYLAGTGVPQNDLSSVFAVRQAADQGDAPAQLLLGKLYLDGRGVERDPELAAGWFLKAATQGNVGAAYQLGQAYERGEGVPADGNAARRWYRAAADAGQRAAADALVRLGSAALAAPPMPLAPQSVQDPSASRVAATSRTRRVALLIANQTYADASLGLSGPVNDARLLQASLVQAGFAVTLKTNLSLVQMNRELSAFLASVDATTVSVVYYSGHGLEINGVNYLVPTDFRATTGMSASEAVAQGVNIGSFYEQLSAQAEGSLNITILDACRNNPFKARGLKGVADLQGGLKAVALNAGGGDGTIETFTAYAAASGQVALDGDVNGPYAVALARQITVPGQVLEVMFRRVRQEVARVTGNRQVPTSSANLSSEFVFIPAP